MMSMITGKDICPSSHSFFCHLLSWALVRSEDGRYDCLARIFIEKGVLRCAEVMLKAMRATSRAADGHGRFMCGS
jgi:hypothetical protein